MAICFEECCMCVYGVCVCVWGGGGASGSASLGGGGLTVIVLMKVSWQFKINTCAISVLLPLLNCVSLFLSVPRPVWW